MTRSLGVQSQVCGIRVPLEDLSGNFVLRSKLNRLLQGVAVCAFDVTVLSAAVMYLGGTIRHYKDNNGYGFQDTFSSDCQSSPHGAGCADKLAVLRTGPFSALRVF